VVARDSDGQEKQLVAYVIFSESGPVSQQGIREFLAKKLPDYMIPSFFVSLAELPLTPNGKVDVASLPVPDCSNLPGSVASIYARTELERQITSIVADLLKLQALSVEDNFFLLGGHSLFGAQLIARLAKQFHIDIPLRALFEAPTVASLAAEIERLRSGQGASPRR